MQYDAVRTEKIEAIANPHWAMRDISVQSGYREGVGQVASLMGLMAGSDVESNPVNELKQLITKKKLMIDAIAQNASDEVARYSGNAGFVCSVAGDSPGSLADQVAASADFGPELVFSVGVMMVAKRGQLNHIAGVLGV